MKQQWSYYDVKNKLCVETLKPRRPHAMLLQNGKSTAGGAGSIETVLYLIQDHTTSP